MTSRLDRLLLLLDTGSSTSVRTTAAKQLAQLAVKSVISDVAIVEDDIKTTRQHGAVSDPAAWSELMSVVARILPYLHSKSHETRSATSVALSQIFTLVPVWQPDAEAGSKTPGEAKSLPAPEFPAFSVRELMEKGTLLLASSGKEFVKPSGILANSTEVKKARKEAMGRLGLDFLDSVGGADDIDLEKELAAEDQLDQDIEMQPVKTEEDVKSPITAEPVPVKAEGSVVGPSKSPTPAAPSPAPSNGQPPAEVDLSTLSARERNRLKRKRKPVYNDPFWST
ncbi:hypothetical protein NM688_g5024 [Phlebia brevispora]|uniref:Uncharacterized protein n=1 Tax=Phlebia brevispora TaxID=194682 RepID=A0ACC1T1D0_9APHY|nr:hypothetical protein NM688_g5024 [Phlebia brevispora]